MGSIQFTGCIWKGEKATAYLLDDGYYAVQASYGQEKVHGGHPDLFLCGPLMDEDELSQEQERQQLDELYADLNGWFDTDDIEYYVDLLERLPFNTVKLDGREYHYDTDDLTDAQDWFRSGPEYMVD